MIGHVTKDRQACLTLLDTTSGALLLPVVGLVLKEDNATANAHRTRSLLARLAGVAQQGQQTKSSSSALGSWQRQSHVIGSTIRRPHIACPLGCGGCAARTCRGSPNPIPSHPTIDGCGGNQCPGNASRSSDACLLVGLEVVELCVDRRGVPFAAGQAQVGPEGRHELVAM